MTSRGRQKLAINEIGQASRFTNNILKGNHCWNLDLYSALRQDLDRVRAVLEPQASSLKSNAVGQVKESQAILQRFTEKKEKKKEYRRDRYVAIM